MRRGTDSIVKFSSRFGWVVSRCREVVWWWHYLIPGLVIPSCISTSLVQRCSSPWLRNNWKKGVLKRHSLCLQPAHRVSQVLEITRGADRVPDRDCVHRFSPACSCELWTGRLLRDGRCIQTFRQLIWMRKHFIYKIWRRLVKLWFCRKKHL